MNSIVVMRDFGGIPNMFQPFGGITRQKKISTKSKMIVSNELPVQKVLSPEVIKTLAGVIPPDVAQSVDAIALFINYLVKNPVLGEFISLRNLQRLWVKNSIVHRARIIVPYGLPLKDDPDGLPLPMENLRFLTKIGSGVNNPLPIEENDVLSGMLHHTPVKNRKEMVISLQEENITLSDGPEDVLRVFISGIIVTLVAVSKPPHPENRWNYKTHHSKDHSCPRFHTTSTIDQTPNMVYAQAY